MSTFPANRRSRLIGLADSLEKWTLVLLVAVLLCFALLQVILRNFFSTGIVWGDSLSRHLVLWIGLLGATRATMERKHILIDVAPRVLNQWGKILAEVVSSSFSFFVSILLFCASFAFVRSERTTGTLAFGEMHLWWLEIIFPLAFAVMAARFGWHLLEAVYRLSMSRSR